MANAITASVAAGAGTAPGDSKGSSGSSSGNGGAESCYEFRGGLRYVRPYRKQFAVYTKKRWLNRSVLSVLTAEFKVQNQAYYESALRDGLITVNGKRVEPEYKLQNKDLLEQSQERTEPAVTAAAIQIIPSTKTDTATAYASGDHSGLLVINKPGSIPVHPTGRFERNSVLEILRIENGLENLFVVNRLDRLTSGVTLLARSSAAASKYCTLLQSKQLAKVYVARVCGKFPDAVTVNEPITCVNARLCKYDTCDDADPATAGAADTEAAAGQQTDTKSKAKRKRSSAADDDSAGGGGDGDGSKSACTHFERLSYNGTTSVVRCKPVTGRTHQIRVHLRWLRHPIANDPQYAIDTTTRFCSLPASEGVSDVKSSAAAASPPLALQPPRAIAPAAGAGIWLHALSYSGPDFHFETPPPDWALPDFTPPKHAADAAGTSCATTTAAANISSPSNTAN